MVGMLRRCLLHEASQDMPHLYVTIRFSCKVGFKIFSCTEIAVAMRAAVSELSNDFIRKKLGVDFCGHLAYRYLCKCILEFFSFLNLSIGGVLKVIL